MSSALIPGLPFILLVHVIPEQICLGVYPQPPHLTYKPQIVRWSESDRHLADSFIPRPFVGFMGRFIPIIQILRIIQFFQRSSFFLIINLGYHGWAGNDKIIF